MFKAWAANQKSAGHSGAGNGPDAIHKTRPVESDTPTTSGGANGKKPTSKRLSPAQLRINADLAVLSDHEMVRVNLTSDSQELKVLVKPTSGPYRNGTIEFTVKFPDDYPHKPPRVRCLQSIYHPNIEPAGGVCLDILREAWTPIRGLADIVIGLRHIILHPNATDPLNADAAENMMADYEDFESRVRQTMKGTEYKGITYSNILS